VRLCTAVDRHQCGRQNLPPTLLLYRQTSVVIYQTRLVTFQCIVILILYSEPRESRILFSVSRVERQTGSWKLNSIRQTTRRKRTAHGIHPAVLGQSLPTRVGVSQDIVEEMNEIDEIPWTILHISQNIVRSSVRWLEVLDWSPCASNWPFVLIWSVFILFVFVSCSYETRHVELYRVLTFKFSPWNKHFFCF
jgi:hypothetical protein